MKIETREIYKCEYCNKLYQIKTYAEAHEVGCSKNPNNYRKCLDGCIHLTKKDTLIYHDTPFGENEEKITLLFCEKRDVFLYPPKVEHKHNAFDLGDDINDPMPKECKVYDDGRLNTKSFFN